MAAESVLGSPVLSEGKSVACGGSRLTVPIAAQPPCRVCALRRGIKINNLSRCEAPQAVEHPRHTENPPGTPSGRRWRLEPIQSPVERLFPPSGGVSRGSVRVGGETFLLPSYGFSFGYKRKGVSFAPLTEARRKIVGQKIRVNAMPCRKYNPSVFSACKTSRKSSSPYTGEPRSAFHRLSVAFPLLLPLFYPQNIK